MSGHRHSASYRSSNAHCIAPQLSALQLAQSPDESINQRANRSIGITTEEMSASDAFRPLLFEPCLRSRLESVSETRFAYLARIRRWALANARTRLFSSSGAGRCRPSVQVSLIVLPNRMHSTSAVLYMKLNRVVYRCSMQDVRFHNITAINE